MFNLFQVGAWNQASSTLGKLASGAIQKGIDTALEHEAKQIKKLLIMGMDSGAPGGIAFHPHSPNTIAVRSFLGMGRTPPMLQTKTLRNSIDIQKVQGGYFVGVMPTAGHPSGMSAQKLGMIHEHGTTITIQKTPQMIRFLMAALSRAGNARKTGNSSSPVIVIKIPPRPFIEPTLNKYIQDRGALKRIASTFAKQGMGGMLGTP